MITLINRLADVPQGDAAIIGSIAAAIIAPLVGLIITLRLSGKVKAIQSDASQTKDQVVNGHKKPNGDPLIMRDELDERHAEQMDTLNQIRTEVKANTRRLNDVSRDIGGIRQDVRQLHDDDAEQRGRIRDLEHTYNRDELGRFTKKESTE